MPIVCVAALALAALAAFLFVRRRRRKQAAVDAGVARAERRSSRHVYSQSGRAISAGNRSALAPAAQAVTPERERANL